jgi:hypothetical protein
MFAACFKRFLKADALDRERTRIRAEREAVERNEKLKRELTMNLME